MMRFLILCLLALPLVSLAAAQNDLSGTLTVLHFPWRGLVEYQPGMYLTEGLSLDAPYQIVGVCADDHGVDLTVRQTLTQSPLRVRFVFAVSNRTGNQIRFSRFWDLVAVGVKIHREGWICSLAAWEVSADPPDGLLDADTGEVRRRP